MFSVLAVGGGQPTDRSLPGPTTSFPLSDPRPVPQLGFAQFSQIKLEVRSSTLSPWNVLGLIIIAFLLAFVCLVCFAKLFQVLIGAFVRTRWKRRQFEEISHSATRETMILETDLISINNDQTNHGIRSQSYQSLT